MALDELGGHTLAGAGITTGRHGRGFFSFNCMASTCGDTIEKCPNHRNLPPAAEERSRLLHAYKKPPMNSRTECRR
jgi:hypothetical protein